MGGAREEWAESSLRGRPGRLEGMGGAGRKKSWNVEWTCR